MLHISIFTQALRHIATLLHAAAEDDAFVQACLTCSRVLGDELASLLRRAVRCEHERMGDMGAGGQHALTLTQTGQNNAGPRRDRTRRDDRFGTSSAGTAASVHPMFRGQSQQQQQQQQQQGLVQMSDDYTTPRSSHMGQAGGDAEGQRGGARAGGVGGESAFSSPRRPTAPQGSGRGSVDGESVHSSSNLHLSGAGNGSGDGTARTGNDDGNGNGDGIGNGTARTGTTTARRSSDGTHFSGVDMPVNMRGGRTLREQSRERDAFGGSARGGSDAAPRTLRERARALRCVDEREREIRREKERKEKRREMNLLLLTNIERVSVSVVRELAALMRLKTVRPM